MHLHGHVFDVVRSAGQDGYNYVNPPRRDVVSIGNTTDNGERLEPYVTVRPKLTSILNSSHYPLRY